MSDQFSRTRLLIGTENLIKLQQARVAVFGIGGVGGYVVEALARSGVGTLDLIDHDVVCVSNINRQLTATWGTLGRYKVDVAKEHILDINPSATVNVFRTFYLPEVAKCFDFIQYDYVVDAIDTVAGKIGLVTAAKEVGVPIISSMGAGNKLDATAFEVADLCNTSVCPLARVMRKELRTRGIEHLKVVYSKEKAIVPKSEDRHTEHTLKEHRSDLAMQPSEHCAGRRSIPGSVAFVPSVVGLILAGEVIKDIISGRNFQP